MKSMYGRQFATMAGMVLLSFFLLGASFAALSYQYTLKEKQDTLMRNAQYIADYTSYAANKAASTTGNGSTVWTTTDFQQYIATVAQVADSHIIVATNDGTILFATDGKRVLYEMSSKSMPRDIVNTVIQDQVYEGMTNLGGLYSNSRFMVGLPIATSNGFLQGLVFFSTNTSDITAMWRDLSAIFIVVSCAVILVAAILSSVTSLHQSKPMKEIAAALLGVEPEEGGLPLAVVSDGRVNLQALARLGRDQAWLEAQLARRGLSGPEDVFFLTVDEAGKVFLVEKEARK